VALARYAAHAVSLEIVASPTWQLLRQLERRVFCPPLPGLRLLRVREFRRAGYLPAYRVAMKTMANSDAIAVRLQKTCMGQRQCRQKSSIQAMTIAALPTIT
jgi:hypothetical protein